jgi:hypothetical protein
MVRLQWIIWNALRPGAQARANPGPTSTVVALVTITLGEPVNSQDDLV